MAQNLFKFKTVKDKELIYDAFRKKYVVLTPEEWVRQQILVFLVKEKKYPASMISVEKQIKVGSKLKRYDAVVYKKENPWMIIECKEENETLNDATLQQLLSYNATLRVTYLVITNGKQLFVYHVENSIWSSQFPTY
jgi:predicted type IV restriction endonuclease